MDEATLPIRSIKRGRAIDTASIKRRAESGSYTTIRAGERRRREKDPYRKLTAQEERVLRRFGYDPYQDVVEEDE